MFRRPKPSRMRACQIETGIIERSHSVRLALHHTAVRRPRAAEIFTQHHACYRIGTNALAESMDVVTCLHVDIARRHRRHRHVLGHRMG